MNRLRAFLIIPWLLLTSVALAQGQPVKVVALFTDKALIQVGSQQKIIAKGETFEGVTLKSASHRGAVVEVGGETMTLKLNQSISGNFKKPERSSLRITADSQGMYFVMGRINGQVTEFLVDTGATHIAMSSRAAKALRIDYTRGKRGYAQTASGVVSTWGIRLNTVSVGGITLRDVTAAVIEGKHPTKVLLGNSFLKRTEINQAGAVMEITKRY